MDSPSLSIDQDLVFLCGFDETQNVHSKHQLFTPTSGNLNIAQVDMSANHQASCHEQYLQFSSHRQLREHFDEPVYYGSRLDPLFKKIRAEQAKIVAEYFDDTCVEPDANLSKKNSTISFRKSTTIKLNKKIVIKLFKKCEPGFYADFQSLMLEPDATYQLKNIQDLHDAISFIKKYGHSYPVCLFNKITHSYIGLEITSAKDPNELFSFGVKFLKECSFDEFKADSVFYHRNSSSDSSKFSYKIQTFKSELAASYEPMHQAHMVPLSEVIFDRVPSFDDYLGAQQELVEKATELERLNSRFFTSALDSRLDQFNLSSWNRASDFWDLYVYRPLVEHIHSHNHKSLSTQQFKHLVDHQLSSYKNLYQTILLNCADMGFFYLNKNYHLNSAILDLKNQSRKIVLIFFDRDLIASRSQVWTNLLKCMASYVHRIKMVSVVLVDYELHPYLAEKMLAYKKCFYVEYLFRLAGLVRLGLNYSNQGRIVFNDIKLTDASTELNLSRNNLIVLNKYQFNDYFYACFIKELNLKNCSLYDLEPGCFENLNVLQVLDLSGNYIKKLSGQFSRGLNELKVLNLSKCELEEIDDKAFKNLANLESLDLSYNKIKHVREKHLESLMVLESLDLGHNKIEQFENNMPFLTMSSLKKLYLNSNMFTSIDPLLFICLIKLEVLSLAGNKIQTLGNIFGNLKNLKILALNSCQIGKIKDDAFEDLESIEVILLHMNEVDFKSEVFQNLTTLQVLTLFSRYGDRLDQYKGMLDRNAFTHLKFYVHKFNEKKIDSLISKFSRHPYSGLINEFYLKSYL